MDSLTDTCPACGATDVRELGDLGSVVVECGTTWPSRAQALRCHHGRMLLVGCGQCGHVWNARFRPELMAYDEHYDASLDHSEVFQRYERALVDRLSAWVGHRPGTVVEIGSGQGHFLHAVCEQCGLHGIGFEPQVSAARGDERVRITGDPFTADRVPRDVTLVVARHVLEHVPEVRPLLAELDVAAHRAPIRAYFEVPSAAFVLRKEHLWDLIYPHVHYFNQRSLATLVARCGGDVQAVHRAYHGQFLCARAAFPGDRTTQSFPRPEGLGLPAVSKSLNQHVLLLQEWRDWLEELSNRGERVALWGAGSKGTTFVTQADPERHLSAVVDVNPAKQHRFLAGSGHQVIAPEELPRLGVDVVVVANEIYRDEVADRLSQLSLDPELVTL